MDKRARIEAQMRRSTGTRFVAVILAGWSLPAVAQTSEGETQGSEPQVVSKEGPLEEIIVTGRKRSESLARVPESITSVSSKTLEAAGITNVSKLATIVPGFSQIRSQDPSNNFIIVRGITQVRNGEPSVAFVVDGVQASSPDQASQELFDIERVEVLKGPQGPTYGRNAIGGAVVITTKAPTRQFEGYATGEYAEGTMVRGQASVSGPLAGDNLLFRLTGGYRNDQGQLVNVTTGDEIDEIEEYAVRGRILATPSDALKVDLRASHSDADGASGGYFPIYPGQDAETRNPIVANRLGRGGRKLTDASAKLDLSVGTAVLTSISSFAKSDASTIDQDIDFLPFPVAPTFPGVLLDQTRNVKSWSQELRVASRDEPTLQWMFGGYYLRTRRDVVTSVFLDLDDFRGPLLSLLPEENRNNAYALFGNVRANISTNLTAELGLRQDWDVRRQHNPASGSRVNDTFKALQPKASLSYFPSDISMIYASVGRGFRSGGFNVEAPLFSRRYPAEISDTLELGAKTKLFGRRVSLNAATFYTRGRNAQTFLFDGTTGAQGILTINRTHFYGAELEARAALWTGLEISAGAALLHSEIDDFDGTGIYRGNKIPLVNHESLSLGIQYNRRLSGNLALAIRGDYAGFGNLRWHVDNLPNERRGWVDLINARIGLEAPKWSLSVFADNLFDEKYAVEFDAARFTGTPTDIAVPNPRRRLGVTSTFRF